MPKQPRPKRPSDEHRLDREMGCIVTAISEDGHPTVHHQGGKTLEALRHIADTLPAGTKIKTISTWRTVLGDLRGEVRRNGGLTDPYSVERGLLGKIGRMDMLVADGDPVWGDLSPSHQRHPKEAA